MTEPIPIREFERQQKQNRAQEPLEERELRPPEFTDEALALRFAERHANDLRYVAAWGRWLHWTGTTWSLDETLLAFDKARAICREAAAACIQSRIAAAVASAKNRGRRRTIGEGRPPTCGDHRPMGF